MCQQIKCSECGKATWSGCGEHIEEALQGIPESARCQGHESEKTGFFASLFGR